VAGFFLHLARLLSLLGRRPRLLEQITRFLQLPQILEHHRQVRLPDGNGAMSKLKCLLRHFQGIPAKLSRENIAAHVSVAQTNVC
jgi:hypothetical protein